MSKETKAAIVAKGAGASEATTARRARFSAPRKAQAVLRLLRGEDMELLSRELGVIVTSVRTVSYPPPSSAIFAQYPGFSRVFPWQKFLIVV